MTIEFLPEAEEELIEAISHYDEQVAGLGDRFNREVWQAIDRIATDPKAYTPVTRKVRKCNVHGFPYGDIYREQVEVILIVAVMHLHRRPGYWRKRLR